MRTLKTGGSLAFGLWLLLLVTNPGRNETIDVEMRRAVARRIWSAGTVTVSEIPPGTLNWVPVGPKTWVAPYGVGQSLLFVPFDAVGAALERLSPATWKDRVGWLPIGLLLLPLVGLACWLAMGALLREWGIEGPWDKLGALVMSVGTMMFHYAGQGQEEMLVGLLLTLSILFAVRLRRKPTWDTAVLCGACAGFSLVVRPISVFALAIVPVLVVSAGASTVARLRLVTLVGAATVVVASLALWYNYARFGSPFVVGYDRLGHVSKIALDGRSPFVILSLLFGPGVGLFVVSPVLFSSFAGFRELWRCDRFYVVGMAASVVSAYLFFSSWHDSYLGGAAWGPRYQCHLLPLFVLPLTLGLRRAFASATGRKLALGLIALSVVFQVMSVVVTHHLEFVQANCDKRFDEPYRDSFVDGQLERRIGNVARWATHRSPTPTSDPGCAPMVAVMWDRYVPNFWGPVFAHRMSRGGVALVGFWLVLVVWSVVVLASAIRRELRPRPGLDLLSSG